MQRGAAPSQIRMRVVGTAVAGAASRPPKSEDSKDKSSLMDESVRPSSSPSVRLVKPFKPPFNVTKPTQFKSPLIPRPVVHNAGTGSAVSTSTTNEENKRASDSTNSTARKHLKLTNGSLSKVLHPSSVLKPSLSSTTTTSSGQGDRCFSVLWRKKTGKKHKTWDGDGVLVVTGSNGVLKDLEGKDIAKAIKISSDITGGDELSFGGKDIEIVSSLDLETYRSGRCFMSRVTQPGNTISAASTTPAPMTRFKGHHSIANRVEASYSPPQPRHSPDAPGAILLPRPRSTHPRVIDGCGSKRSPGDAGLVDVVVDPLLGQHLRPHQKEGVRFLYECVMEMKGIQGQGAILADEMGLGKTLQTIALLWTLLKQSPYHGEESSVAKKALVVCPASLIMNWQKEFKKWLGTERIRVFAVDSKSSITDFTLGKIYPVMIIGYEKLRIVQDELKSANFDIIICDEGHRLKAANIKTTLAIRSLSTKRRIILSGTPIQNDLGEFFCMIDFVNPGLFESYSTFKRVFEDPILRSRQPDCSTSEAALGLERSQELTRLTAQFILRRTAQVNYEFLPRKTELVIFCQPSPLQRTLYRRMVDSTYLQSCFTVDGSRHLACIAALRKLCNSPKLVLDQAEAQEDQETRGLYSDIRPLIEDRSLDLNNSCGGGKLSFVEALLKSIHGNTAERVVLVSNFTQTLDVLEALCVRLHYGFFRLDGSTPSQKRQEYVDKFNEPSCQKFVFLLSAKSGGMGLNLVGASRLVMFDIDWNPSVDLQAMARIHRDGQLRPVYIYRLLLSGTIEEKMYQRQSIKVGLSDALMDAKSAEKLNKFSTAELRDLFTFHEDESCLTHSLLGCECNRGTETRGNAQQFAGGRPRLDRNGIMDRASASLTRKEIEEWVHVDIQAWSSTWPRGTRIHTVKEEAEKEVEEEEIDSPVYGWKVDTLATKDKVLWSAIVDSGDGQDDWEQDDEGEPGQEFDAHGHVGPVNFVFFSGGMELLFDNQKTIQAKVPVFFNDKAEATGSQQKHAATVRDLIAWVTKTHLKERPELFVGEDGSVRSGILVLINGADWELEGELEYELQDRDEVVFISTLHGG